MLLIGGTGQIGSAVVSKLATERGIDLGVLTPNPDKAQAPANVTVVKGDVLDMASMRSALAGVGTLFLLNPVVADEHTRALLTLRLATDAGVKGVVYFSMANSDVFADTPHASAKFGGHHPCRHGGARVPGARRRPSGLQRERGGRTMTGKATIQGIRSETVTVGGVRFHYWIGGPAGGRPVVLWHELSLLQAADVTRRPAPFPRRSLGKAPGYGQPVKTSVLRY
jgi:hypothetical protein